MKTFAIVMGAMFAMSAAACGGKKEEAAGGGGGEAAAGDLPAACKKVIDTAKACFAEAGDAGKAGADAFAQTEKAWADAVKAGGGASLEAGCKQAWDGMKQMGAMCPKVKWE